LELERIKVARQTCDDALPMSGVCDRRASGKGWIGRKSGVEVDARTYKLGDLDENW
jgi:hypothetical protein